MRKFQVGDRVRCIDGTPIKALDKNNEGVVTFADSDFIKFEGQYSSGWWHHRFELVEKHDNAWIPWSGGECPVPKGTTVWYRLRDDSMNYLASHAGDAHLLRWHHLGLGGDILSYRIKEHPEVKTNKAAAPVSAAPSGVASATRRKRVLLLT